MKYIKWLLSLMVLVVCFSFGSATGVYAKQVDGCVKIPCPAGQKFDHKSCACVIKHTPKYSMITVEEAKAMMENDNVTVLDVRSAEEYADGHIAGALSLPVDDMGSFIQSAKSILPDKDATILVYCGCGVRAATAADKLVQRGYTDVYDLGGLTVWPYGTVK